ncbi:MAG: hypothetical protein R3C05_01710 [Pirellulaceae bacterium]
MRNIFILGVLLVAASAAGWFSIDREDGQTKITINRDEIRNDAKEAIAKGKQYLDERKSEYRYSEGYEQANQPGVNPYSNGQTYGSQDNSGLRYTQEGGQYNAQGRYTPPPYIPLNSSNQSNDYPYRPQAAESTAPYSAAPRY